MHRSRSAGGLGRIWANSCSQNRLQEPRGRNRLSTVIQPLRQNAGEVVDLTVDEDGKAINGEPSFTVVLFSVCSNNNYAVLPQVSVFKPSAGMLPRYILLFFCYFQSYLWY